MSHAGTDGGVTNHAERRRCEVAVRVSKLCMIQCVEELSAKLNAASLNGPIEQSSFGERDIQVRLPRAIHDTCGAVSKARPNTVRTNNWRFCKTS